MSVHYFRANKQPLTNYFIMLDVGGRTVKSVTRHKPRRQAKCHQCGTRRWAKNLVIQVYYDAMIVTCAAGCESRRDLLDWRV